MRVKVFGFAVASIVIGYLILVAPGIVGFTVIIFGAITLWGIRPRRAMRR